MKLLVLDWFWPGLGACVSEDSSRAQLLVAVACQLRCTWHELHAANTEDLSYQQQGVGKLFWRRTLQRLRSPFQESDMSSSPGRISDNFKQKAKHKKGCPFPRESFPNRKWVFTPLNDVATWIKWPIASCVPWRMWSYPIQNHRHLVQHHQLQRRVMILFWNVLNIKLIHYDVNATNCCHRR